MPRHKHVTVYFTEEELTKIQEVAFELEDIPYTDPNRHEIHQKFVKGSGGAPITSGVFIRTAALAMVEHFEQYRKTKRLPTGC